MQGGSEEDSTTLKLSNAKLLSSGSLSLPHGPSQPLGSS
jgi:hypothetical protein